MFRIVLYKHLIYIILYLFINFRIIDDVEIARLIAIWDIAVSEFVE